MAPPGPPRGDTPVPRKIIIIKCDHDHYDPCHHTYAGSSCQENFQRLQVNLYLNSVNKIINCKVENSIVFLLIHMGSMSWLVVHFGQQHISDSSWYISVSSTSQIVARLSWQHVSFSSTSYPSYLESFIRGFKRFRKFRNIPIQCSKLYSTLYTSRPNPLSLTARKKVAQNSNMLRQCKCNVNDMIRIYFVLLKFLFECIRVPALMVVPTILIHQIFQVILF